MRLLLLVTAASLTACSGLPPETLPALKGGEVVTGVTLAFDMQKPSIKITVAMNRTGSSRIHVIAVADVINFALCQV